MMCYRDATFCTASCANTGCSLKYTDSIQQQAIAWWGSDEAPIAIGDMSGACTAYLALNETTVKIKPNKV